MASKIHMCICILTLSSFLSAQVIPRSARRNGKRNVADPVSDFFSELGDLFLDVDQSFSEQTAPKVASQDQIINLMLRPSTDYFNKVQENYKTLHKRLGNIVRDSIGPKSVYRDRDLTTVGPLILEEEKFSTETSSQAAEKTKTLSEAGWKKQRKPLQMKKTNLKNDEDCSEGILNPLTGLRKHEKCSKLERRHQMRESIEKKIAEIKRVNELLTSDGEEMLKSSNVFSQRDGEVSESGSYPDGRLFGDALYSESSFDKYVRQLLRDHGKWVLDNPLLSRWRKSGSAAKDEIERTSIKTEEIPLTIDESSTDMDSNEDETQSTTVDIETVDIEPTNVESKSREIPMSKNYYSVVDDDGVVEEIDIVLSPLSDNKIKDNFKTADMLKDKGETKETVILAFTPNGVPLKLRMGPEIKNPVRFLNGVLKSAGVSLNVPVESYDDIEPVGKEVMKYGAGVLTRALYLDLSRDDELKSLLKTLMKSKLSKVQEI